MSTFEAKQIGEKFRKQVRKSGKSLKFGVKKALFKNWIVKKYFYKNLINNWPWLG